MEIEVVVFVVHGQSSSLSDCMDAYADNFAGYGHRPEVCVVDSTSDPSERNASRESLARVHRRHGLNVRFSSEREVEKFLSHGGPESLRYAMTGDWRIGFGREAVLNRGLLIAHGRPALFIDADMRCAMAGSPGSSPCLRSRSGVKAYRYDPYQYEVATGCIFADEAELDRTVPAFRKIDVLKVMGQYLGRDVGSCASEHRHSSGRSSGTVRLSKMGIWGDVGVPYASQYALSESFAAADIAMSNDRYASLVSSRTVRCVSADWVIGPTPILDRSFFAASNSSLLMPFLPTGGSSSGASIPGLLESACAPESLTMEIPWAMRRVGGAQAFASGSAVDGASRMSLHDLMFVLVEMLAESGDISGIGAGLVRFAGLPDQDFLVLLRNASRVWARRMCFRVERKLNRYTGASDQFVSDMQGLIDTYRQMLENEAYRIPYEIRTGAYSFESDRIIRRQLDQYGSLLSSWGAIAEHVASLRARGIGVGVKP